MILVTVDQKMRIRLPKRVAKKFEIGAKEMLGIEMKDGGLFISKPKKRGMTSYPLLRDMVEHPLYSKVKITTELLENMEEEMYK